MDVEYYRQIDISVTACLCWQGVCLLELQRPKKIKPAQPYHPTAHDEYTYLFHPRQTEEFAPSQIFLSHCHPLRRPTPQDGLQVARL